MTSLHCRKTTLAPTLSVYALQSPTLRVHSAQPPPAQGGTADQGALIVGEAWGMMKHLSTHYCHPSVHPSIQQTESPPLLLPLANGCERVSERLTHIPTVTAETRVELSAPWAYFGGVSIND
ncbi:hypothetical protein AAFF_G00143810 [Aldrovandia affinis]|uniref:Uncharacterized protein n=1 Tax=Aldrovandia affinis TaxID=143900 RepID=A0AAD7T0F5_9TELE|nr:hypothetical protein AAFF_G00143810 [Aldrovandia affinis]